MGKVTAGDQVPVRACLAQTLNLAQVRRPAVPATMPYAFGYLADYRVNVCGMTHRLRRPIHLHGCLFTVEQDTYRFVQDILTMQRAFESPAFPVAEKQEYEPAGL